MDTLLLLLLPHRFRPQFSLDFFNKEEEEEKQVWHLHRPWCNRFLLDICRWTQVRLVEEADDEPIRRPQRGYIRSVVAIDWESSRQGDQENDQDQDRNDNDDDDDDNWQQTVNVTCSASNTIARQTHTDTRMFNLERVRPGDVRGIKSTINQLFLFLFERKGEFPISRRFFYFLERQQLDFFSVFSFPASTGEQEDEANDSQAGAGYCGRYTGNICRGQLSNPASVWYNISSNDQTGGWLNEQLVHGLWDEVVNTLREPCKSAAKVTTLHLPPLTLACCLTNWKSCVVTVNH
jgi:hypothetical protein